MNDINLKYLKRDYCHVKRAINGVKGSEKKLIDDDFFSFFLLIKL